MIFVKKNNHTDFDWHHNSCIDGLFMPDTMQTIKGLENTMSDIYDNMSKIAHDASLEANTLFTLIRLGEAQTEEFDIHSRRLRRLVKSLDEATRSLGLEEEVEE